jgi:hypothetical protein
MESQIKAIYITKKESVGHGDVIGYNNKNVIYFQYHEFIDKYLSGGAPFRKFVFYNVADVFEGMVPNCEIIFLERTDDYIFNKFNEYLIERLKNTNIKCEYVESVVDFKQIKDGKFVNE